MGSDVAIRSVVNFAIAIACLNATGMSIEDMRTYLKNRSLGPQAADEQVALLETQQQRLAEEARNLELRLHHRSERLQGSL